jgi:RNA polymerase sigma-70 factor, ECF subfamily
VHDDEDSVTDLGRARPNLMRALMLLESAGADRRLDEDGPGAGRETPRPHRPYARGVETDADLLGRLRNGDEEAFVMLVGRYQGTMLQLATSMVNSRAVAEEAVQDTWMGVVRGIDRFEGRSSFKTWLFRILANRARSAGSREYQNVPFGAVQAVDPSRFDQEGKWIDPPGSWVDESEHRLDAARYLPVLKAALEDLPSRQRQVVVLRDVEGLSSEETCAVLNISHGNQRILLHRGRTRLRDVLDSELRGD